MEHIHWLYGVVTLGLFIWSMRTRDERSNLLREVAYLTSKVGYLAQALSLSQGEERGLAQDLGDKAREFDLLKRLHKENLASSDEIDKEHLDEVAALEAQIKELKKELIYSF